MKNKAIWIVILILLITLITISIYAIGYLTREKIGDDKAEFSFNVSMADSKFLNQTNFIEIEGHRVTIRQSFSKPSPCNNVNYTVSKNNFTVDIIPEDITSNSGTGGCAAMMSADFVEINLVLSTENYTLNLYSWWNKDSPFLSREIAMGNDDNLYEKCMNETNLPEEYVQGDVIVDFKDEATGLEKQNFEMNLGANVYVSEYYNKYGFCVVRVPEGRELEWMCKLKDYPVVKDTRLKEIGYPE